ncbi:MAG: AsnC family transcriptional regulator [Deltaproteobacteria bacterium]|jgi:DNA-binding Lrp family transcriptional regulator|nr:AsnC family transcriptional regulator [Deltaproteobacteria bacterium]
MIAEKTDNGLDHADRRLLDIIQTDFPLAARPYAVLGAALGLDEEETLERVRDLRRRGIIRRIGANFQSARLGFVSTLCAAKVSPENFDAFVATINAHPGVTHNYLREHSYNVWFTLIAPDQNAIRDTLAAITARTGVAVLNLPASRMYKIRVDFPMQA